MMKTPTKPAPKRMPPTSAKLRIGLVVPHLFIHKEILPHVIFSPGTLALSLAAGLERAGADVTLFTPGPADTHVRNLTADLSGFEAELKLRDDSYLDLLKKHPLTFVSLSRQAQSEILARAYALANAGELDLVHVYCNEEDTALPFAQFCTKPVVFTHHDPFSYLARYRARFPLYPHLNWISISLAQRRSMPASTNWVGNIYHGLDPARFQPNYAPKADYIAYLGRLIEPKGVHLAIEAIKQHNAAHPEDRLTLKLAGMHYASAKKSDYWHSRIEPALGPEVDFVGRLAGDAALQDFLGNARALIIPSTYDEPFGMVMIEALACATPIIGLSSGAIPEVVKSGQTGLVTTPKGLAQAISDITAIGRYACRADFEARFTLDQMVQGHLTIYKKLATPI
jgi:glycosyltransferase involved in cell wall biosynthesis